jgi:hypothetical protein
VELSKDRNSTKICKKDVIFVSTDRYTASLYRISTAIKLCDLVNAVGKNCEKNTENPAIFSAKKRENLVLFLTGH